MPLADGGAHGVEVDAVAQFLYREARLLDQRRYEEWLALFTDDASYWLPLQRGQRDPLETASLVYDDRMALEMRVRQLGLANRHAQRPPSWTTHVVGNVVIDAMAADGAIEVGSTVLVLESRGDQRTLWGGQVRHVLRRDDDDFRIAAKRIDLVDCDAMLGGIFVPL